MRRAFTLLEVVCAAAVMAVAFLPLFSMMSAARHEGAEASGLLILLERLDAEPRGRERAPRGWPLTAATSSARDGGRAIALDTIELDPDACVAPLLEEGR